MPMNRRPDPGRTIGNGVVIGYVASAAVPTVLAVYGVIDGLLAVGIATAMFLVLFAGDLFVQRADMEHEREMAMQPDDAEEQIEVPGPETEQRDAVPVSE